jgi:hypothetical protein
MISALNKGSLQTTPEKHLRRVRSDYKADPFSEVLLLENTTIAGLTMHQTGAIEGPLEPTISAGIWRTVMYFG